jgi:hypothetical protein
MFTTIREYHCHPDDVRDIARLTDEHFADQLAAMDGFVAYEMIDCGSGMVFTMTVFSDRESSMRSNQLAARFVEDHLNDMQLTRRATNTGEVVLNRAESDVMELVHA